MGAKFGPAGNSESFAAMGYKKTIQVPEYIVRMGLDAYEYQCGRGVRISEEAAREFGQKAREYSVTLSLHSPYYISLSSIEKEKRDGSIEYILQSARAADAMGAQRVVVHSGSCSKISREEALELAKDTLKRAYQALDEQNLGHIHLCPETMGKVNQLERWKKCWNCVLLMKGSFPASILGISTLGPSGDLTALRRSKRCSTRWRTSWVLSECVSSIPIFLRLSTRSRVEKSVT